MEERNWKYKINGGWPTLIMASVMLAIFGGITVWLYTTRNGAFIGGLIVTACMAAGRQTHASRPTATLKR